MLKNRIKKLNEKIQPSQPIILLMPGKEPTEAQLLDIARAKAAGIEPHIIQIVKATEAARR